MLAEPDGVRNFQDARRLFETGVAARAAERAAAADIDALGAALEANRQAIGLQRLFHETDFLFHKQIAGVAKNPIFLSVTEGLVTRLLEQRHRTAQDPEHAQLADHAHREIFDVIAARNAEAAGAAMDRHLGGREALLGRAAVRRAIEAAEKQILRTRQRFEEALNRSSEPRLFPKSRSRR